MPNNKRIERLKSGIEIKVVINITNPAGSTIFLEIIICSLLFNLIYIIKKHVSSNKTNAAAEPALPYRPVKTGIEARKTIIPANKDV
ncbi:MAG: hypothetical protein ACM339_08625, partial [Ignavibacteria bacterium]